jgi:DNA-binding CsgD family transcriptional regulator
MEPRPAKSFHLGVGSSSTIATKRNGSVFIPPKYVSPERQRPKPVDRSPLLAFAQDGGRRGVATESSLSPDSGTGFVLVDSSQRAIYFNAAALRMFASEPNGQNLSDLNQLLPHTLRAILSCGRHSSCATEFSMGTDRYVCRAFSLHHNSGDPTQSVTGLLIEPCRSLTASNRETALRFGLTPREQEAVGLLTLGLTSKEIASRMKISPNTVKAFFRLIMMKLSVNTRSGIVGKIAGT